MKNNTLYLSRALNLCCATGTAGPDCCLLGEFTGWQEPQAVSHSTWAGNDPMLRTPWALVLSLQVPCIPILLTEALEQLKCLWQPWGRTAPWCLQMGRSEASRLGTRCWRRMDRAESLPGSQEQPTRHSVCRRNSWKMYYPGKGNRAQQCLPSYGLQVPDAVCW